MCWCDPQKRTPICDDCPPERKAEWTRYSDSMPKCPYCGEQATSRERNTYYCSKTHYWQEDASKVYASLEAQQAARPEIPAGNAEALEKAREVQIEAFIASHVSDPNYRTTADYIRGFMREQYKADLDSFVQKVSAKVTVQFAYTTWANDMYIAGAIDSILIETQRECEK